LKYIALVEVIMHAPVKNISAVCILVMPATVTNTNARV